MTGSRKPGFSEWQEHISELAASTGLSGREVSRKQTSGTYLGGHIPGIFLADTTGLATALSARSRRPPPHPPHTHTPLGAPLLPTPCCRACLSWPPRHMQHGAACRAAWMVGRTWHWPTSSRLMLLERGPPVPTARPPLRMAPSSAGAAAALRALALAKRRPNQPPPLQSAIALLPTYERK